MNPPELAFNALMCKAQLANGQGSLDEAHASYGQAFAVAQGYQQLDSLGWLDIAKAARGAYETGHRIGVFGSGLEYWQNETVAAVDAAVGQAGLTEVTLRNGAFLTDKTERLVVREMIQTNTVIGKVLLRGAVRHERGNTLGRDMVGAAAERSIVKNFREAESLLPCVEGNGPIDQYRINWQTPAAFGERLYGSRMRAARIAGQAVRYANLSESPALPTSAGLPAAARRAAVNRARKRSLAAMAAVMLPRHEALALAVKAV